MNTIFQAGQSGHVAEHDRLASMIGFDVRRFGAVGDGTTDDTSAIRAAINAADALESGSRSGPPVIFPPGAYKITDTITTKDHPMIGAGPFATTIQWDGTTGDTAFSAGEGRNYWQGFRFLAGGTEPGTWISFNDTDYGDHILDCFFGDTDSGTTENCAVNVGSVINMSMRRVRFARNKYAVLVEQDASASGSRPLTIEDFTIDWNNVGGSDPQAFVGVKMGGSNSNLTLKLANARLEGTAATCESDWSLVRVWSDPANSLNTYPLTVHLDCLQVQAGDLTGRSVIHQDTTQTTVACDVTIDACRFLDIGAIIGGTWDSSVTPTMPTTRDTIRRLDFGRS